MRCKRSASVKEIEDSPPSLEAFREAVEDGIAWNGCLYSTGHISESQMIKVRGKYRGLLNMIDKAARNG